MTARWLQPWCHFSSVVVCLVLISGTVTAQTGRQSVTLTTTVSRTVVLSHVPISTPDGINVDLVSSGNTMRASVSGHGSAPVVVRVPLLIRSNCDFSLSAVFESQAAILNQISVVDVHATGRLVSPGLLAAFSVSPDFDLRGFNDSGTNSAPGSLPDAKSIQILKSPRVSLGGTLTSPDNALQVTLLIRVNPGPSSDWLAHLTFLGTAVPTGQ